MLFQLYNHKYYRTSNCCVGCRSFVNDSCSYVNESCGKCYGWCQYDPDEKSCVLHMNVFMIPHPNKIYLFGYNSIADQITILNFLYPNKVLLVSQDWYKHMLEYGYSSDCAFICEISKFRHTPLIPQLLTDSELFV